MLLVKPVNNYRKSIIYIIPFILRVMISITGKKKEKNIYNIK